jgi:hypothetical protein
MLEQVRLGDGDVARLAVPRAPDRRIEHEANIPRDRPANVLDLELGDSGRHFQGHNDEGPRQLLALVTRLHDLPPRDDGGGNEDGKLQAGPVCGRVLPEAEPMPVHRVDVIRRTGRRAERPAREGAYAARPGPRSRYASSPPSTSRSFKKARSGGAFYRRLLLAPA